MIYQVYKYVTENGTKVDTGPTIGGFWSVDKWTIDYNGSPLEAWLMDEGYTKKIRYKGLSVYQSGDNPMVIEAGNMEVLAELENIK